MTKGNLVAVAAAACVLFFVSITTAADELPTLNERMQAAKLRCTQPAEGEPKITMKEFSWRMSPAQIEKKFNEIYVSDKRLYRRSYYDEQKGSFVTPVNRGELHLVTLPESYIRSVIRHIETAIEWGYAEHVFFPDMGHSHLYLPQESWDREMAHMNPSKDLAVFYERLFSQPDLLSLYHTAENLNMTDADHKVSSDRYLAWRFMTRNPVGANEEGGILFLARQLEAPGHAVSRIKGYHSYSSGLALSAHEKGCFSYIKNGKVYYFDIGLEDPPWTNDGENVVYD